MMKEEFYNSLGMEFHFGFVDGYIKGNGNYLERLFKVSFDKVSNVFCL
jgi:hypothetical protein